MPTDPAALTAALIRCPSVTPVEGGALVLLQDSRRNRRAEQVTNPIVAYCFSLEWCSCRVMDVVSVMVGVLYLQTAFCCCSLLCALDIK